MSLTISVVVPCYNDAAMLERCLDALAMQTRPADEIVVVDNGSTDTTVDVARAAGVRVVTESRRGIPQATSAGFDAAVGDVLGRLDADTIPPADWVARVERAFTDDSELDALSGPGRFYGGTAVVRWYAERIHMPMYYRFVAWILGHDVLYGSNLAIRATAWRVLREHVHRERADVTDDLDLAINLQPGMGVVRSDARSGGLCPALRELDQKRRGRADGAQHRTRQPPRDVVPRASAGLDRVP
ncbi:MAG TPA: glycosyltransferase family 2 protein [Agromyces sp.]|nr:glycosyltransferase family 2 protein [Agromyces sp.]